MPPADQPEAVEIEIERLKALDLDALRARWRTEFGRKPPPTLPKHLLFRVLAYRLQARLFGDLSKSTQQFLDRLGRQAKGTSGSVPMPDAGLRAGTVLVREYEGKRHAVTTVADGFSWNGQTYPSLSKVARAITGTNWNGPRFFGLRDKKQEPGNGK